MVLRGSGRMKVDDEIVELKEWDAVRVPPGTWRGYEAGPEGLEILVIGAPNLGEDPREDVDGQRDWWADGSGVKTVVWTDGSCNANGMHGRGGWAALIEQAGTVREFLAARMARRNPNGAHRGLRGAQELTGAIEAALTPTRSRSASTTAGTSGGCAMAPGGERGPGQEPRPLGAVVRLVWDDGRRT